MKILETERLEIRRLQSIDKELFAELFTDPKVLELIPQKAFTENQIKDRFNKSLNLELSDLNDQKCAFGIFERGKTELDRKSTRLNSSHVRISYAVFCLKK